MFQVGRDSDYRRNNDKNFLMNYAKPGALEILEVHPNCGDGGMRPKLPEEGAARASDQLDFLLNQLAAPLQSSAH